MNDLIFTTDSTFSIQSRHIYSQLEFINLDDNLGSLNRFYTTIYSNPRQFAVQRTKKFEDKFCGDNWYAKYIGIVHGRGYSVFWVK